MRINGDLLRFARELGVNLSRTFEERLSEVVRQERRRRWSLAAVGPRVASMKDRGEEIIGALDILFVGV